MNPALGEKGAHCVFDYLLMGSRVYLAAPHGANSRP